jgi:hypothetical protein
MKQYTLWNIKDQKALKHPKFGLWSCGNEGEAEAALGDLHDYLDATGMGHLKSNFTFIEIDTVKDKI